MSRASILLQIIVGGLRDPVRHVKYPDEERCARCGSAWPCPNGAVDELRVELSKASAAREWDRWLIAMLVATEYTQHTEGCPRERDSECGCWIAQVFTAAEARAERGAPIT